MSCATSEIHRCAVERTGCWDALAVDIVQVKAEYRCSLESKGAGPSRAVVTCMSKLVAFLGYIYATACIPIGLIDLG